MADNSHTLDLGSLGAQSTGHNREPSSALTSDAPQRRTSLFGEALHHRRASTVREPAPHQTQPADLVRQHITTLEGGHPLSHLTIPAAPTASLITDKHRLAGRKDLAPGVIHRRLPSMVAPALTALGIFALVLFLFKVPVIYSQLSYALSSPSSPASPSSVTPAGGVVPADSTISIPKINVHAPVEYINSVQEADVQKALQNGVVHYGTTGVPGQNGNVAIFGHSSNDWWESGNYKFVFVLLDKLTIGDKVSLDYQSVRYTYEVTGTRVVEPTAIEVLNPTSTPTLTLITCSPPGTSLKRLVVTAKQISPDPSHTTSVANAPAVNQSTNLPSGNSSWLDSLGAFWSQAFKSTGLFGSSSPTPTASPSGGQLPAIK